MASRGETAATPRPARRLPSTPVHSRCRHSGETERTPSVPGGRSVVDTADCRATRRTVLALGVERQPAQGALVRRSPAESRLYLSSNAHRQSITRVFRKCDSEGVRPPGRRPARLRCSGGSTCQTQCDANARPIRRRSSVRLNRELPCELQTRHPVKSFWTYGLKYPYIPPTIDLF